MFWVPFGLIDNSSGFLHGAYFEGEGIAEVLVGCIKGGGKACDLPHVAAVTDGLTGKPS